VAVLVAVSTVMIMAFAMLVVDMGLIYSAKGDLQRAADSAAMAGVSAFVTDANLLPDQDQATLAALAVSRAKEYALLNTTLKAGTKLDTADVIVGRHDFDHPDQPLATDGEWNAVEVIARRTADSSNGPVALAFARVFGNEKADVTATARAVFVDQAVGYHVKQENNVIPFTIEKSLYDNLEANGPDEYSYDGVVVNQSDDIREVKLFPWKWSNMEEAIESLSQEDFDGDGSGNFGILNVGVQSQSTSTVNNQIENGIFPEQLTNEFGTDELEFFDEDGEPVSYTSTGTPGGHTGMTSTLEVKVGDVVGFFVHSGLPIYNGSNATYEIVGVRYGRIMAVKLSGNPNDRGLYIQPVAYTSDTIIIDDDAPSTGGLIGRIILVR
jgi:hypothetical protein